MGKKDDDCYFDRAFGLANRLKQMAESGDHPDVQDDTYEVKRYQLILGDVVTTSDGGAWIEVGEDQSGVPLFAFEVTLGPTNALKLITFLDTLPAEPDDEDEPTGGLHS